MEELLERVRRLTDQVDRIEDPVAREAARDLAAAVLELHGAGLARIGAVLEEAGPAGAEAKRKLQGDGVVASLLLIHDLYPVPLEERVREALDGIRPYLESHQGDVELIGVEDGVVRLSLRGSCDGCPASASTLELAIKEALEEAAPDIVGLEVEGVVAVPGPAGVELPVLPPRPDGAGRPARTVRTSFWVGLGGIPPGPGEVGRFEVGAAPLAVANVDGSLLAFRDACPACGGRISAGELAAGVLVCPGCERHYFLPRAGRSVDEERLLLEPVPLLESGGEVTVAVG